MIFLSTFSYGFTFETNESYAQKRFSVALYSTLNDFVKISSINGANGILSENIPNIEFIGNPTDKINTNIGIDILEGADLISFRAEIGLNVEKFNVSYKYNNNASFDNAQHFVSISYNIDPEEIAHFMIADIAQII